MKKTRNILLALFCLPLVVAGALYVSGDYLNLDMACLADCPDQTKFIVSTTMILLTLAVLPLSLRLFRFRRVHADLLLRKAEALRKWGSIRLCMLGVLLVVNTALYYAFAFESAFGYLAVITLLTFPFVIPTMNRCLTETEPEPVPDEAGHETPNDPETAPEP